MLAFPSAIVIANNDLTDNIKSCLIKQLYFTDVLDGYSFDGYVSTNPDYVTYIKNSNKRVLVLRSLRDHKNRELADLVLFVNRGMVMVQQNKFGPSQQTFRLAEIYWGRLGIFALSI